MDTNKKARLDEIGYRILKYCAICTYSKFPSPASPWGICEKYEYRHEKHTGEARQVSICHFGVCAEDFEAADGVATRLAGFHDLADFDRPQQRLSD